MVKPLQMESLQLVALALFVVWCMGSDLWLLRAQPWVVPRVPSPICVCPSASGAEHTASRTLQALEHLLAYSLPAKKVSAGKGTEIQDREQAHVFSHVGSLGP